MSSQTQNSQDNFEFQISKRILQNKLTSANFDISRATLLSTLSSFSTKFDQKSPNSSTQQFPFMTTRNMNSTKYLTNQNEQQQKNSFCLEKSPFQSSSGTPQNQQNKTKPEFSMQFKKDGKFKVQIKPNNKTYDNKFSQRCNASLSQTQKSPFLSKRNFSHEEKLNTKINDNQKNSLQLMNKTQMLNNLNWATSPINTSYCQKKNEAIQVIQDFKQFSRKVSENNIKNSYLLNSEEIHSDYQKNLTDRLSDKEKNIFKKVQNASQRVQSEQQNETLQVEEKLQSYLSYLGQNFKTENSSQRIFKNNNKLYKDQCLKTFYCDLQNELSEGKQKKKIVPKLQKIAKKVQNLNSIMNLMDRKYVREKEQQIKKKKLLEDAKNINTDFFNFDSIIQTFCYNLQQFVSLNRNKTISSKKISKLYGFNEIIKSITFDELTGELRNEFTPAIVNFSINQMLNIQDNQGKKQIESLKTIAFSKIKKKNEMNKSEIFKSIYYFNKTLEELNDQKITENRNNEVQVAKQEAELIEQKLQELILQNRVNSIDKKGIFSELKKGIVYNSGNPFYRSSIPLNTTILKSEKSNGQFDFIMFKNRYQSSCIDNICDQFQQI